MGILIKCEGATFDPKYVIDTVDLPDPECEHEYDNACDAECNLCGATRTVTHNYVDGYCTICGKKDPNKVWTIGEYPVTDTLKGLYDLGGTQEASLVNHAPNATNTSDVTGTVVYADSYATFSGKANASRINTHIQIPLANTVTFVALFSVPTGRRPLIGNRIGTGTSASGLDLLNTSVHTCTDSVSSAHDFKTPINSSNFAILAMVADTNDYRVLRYSNGSLVLVDSYDGTISDWLANFDSMAFKLGGDQTSNGYDTAHISLAAIHEGAVTEEQLENICKFVYEYGTQKGLTIE